MAPDCLRQSISVLPPSKYDLRRNHDSGILLATPKVRKKITKGKGRLVVPPPDCGTFFRLR